MPLKAIKRDIKKHRPVDWFAIFILISVAIVVVNILSSRIEKFSKDMDAEARVMQSDIRNLKELIRTRR